MGEAPQKPHASRGSRAAGGTSGESPITETTQLAMRRKGPTGRSPSSRARPSGSASARELPPLSVPSLLASLGSRAPGVASPARAPVSRRATTGRAGVAVAERSAWIDAARSASLGSSGDAYTSRSPASASGSVGAPPPRSRCRSEMASPASAATASARRMHLHQCSLRSASPALDPPAASTRPSLAHTYGRTTASRSSRSRLVSGGRGRLDERPTNSAEPPSQHPPEGRKPKRAWPGLGPPSRALSAQRAAASIAWSSGASRAQREGPSCDVARSQYEISSELSSRSSVQASRA
eukprot:scaffold199559_cov33-Tisochrysis_lutea.AAC.2